MQTRTRERLTPDHVTRHAQLFADPANLILEEHADRLDQTADKLGAYVGGQTADHCDGI